MDSQEACSTISTMIDLHCDTILRLMTEAPEATLTENPFSVSIPHLEAAGAKAQAFALFAPLEEDWSFLCRMHKRFVDEVGASGIKQATCKEELLGDAFKAMLTIEGLGSLQGDDDRLEELLSWKPLIVSLTWNDCNTYAYPNSTDKDIMGRGLTAKGREVVGRLSSQGIVIDTSHLSDGGFWDLVDMGVPMMASHSNCRAITGHQRNLTDEQIRALADRGGVMGLNFCPIFLSDRNDNKSCISDMVRHVMHMYQVGGAGVMALGTDFDGIEGELEIAHPDGLWRLFDALSDAGLPSSAIEAFAYGNALRVLTQSF